MYWVSVRVFPLKPVEYCNWQTPFCLHAREWGVCSIFIAECCVFAIVAGSCELRKPQCTTVDHNIGAPAHVLF
jgi:hypothetical protein